MKLSEYMLSVGTKARAAADELVKTPSDKKNLALLAISSSIIENKTKIIKAFIILVLFSMIELEIANNARFFLSLGVFTSSSAAALALVPTDSMYSLSFIQISLT